MGNQIDSELGSKRTQHATLQALALLLAAVIFNTNTSSFMVIIADIAEHFAPMGMSASQASLIQTLPSLLMIPTVLGGTFLKSKFSQKALTIAGWGIYGSLGLCLIFVDNYIAFIAVRACMGIGIGIALPQAKAMIAKLYDGKKRANLIGYISMTGGLVGVVVSTTLGYVAAYNWRYALLLYPIFAFVVITLVALFVPKLPLEDKKFYSGKSKEPMNKYVWAIIALGCVVFVIGSVVQIKGGMHIRESGFGSTTETGYFASCATFGTFCGGFLFGRIYNKLGRWMFCFSAVIAAAGYYCLATAPSYPVVLISAYFAAFGSVGTIMPYLITRISFMAPPSRKSDAIIYLSAFTYGGQFLGTFFLMAVSALFDGSAKTALIAVAVVYVSLLVVAFIFMMATREESAMVFDRNRNIQNSND